LYFLFNTLLLLIFVLLGDRDALDRGEALPPEPLLLYSYRDEEDQIYLIPKISNPTLLRVVSKY